jgi:GDP-4-dehydro-6-deoxy-D-mannose reductase
LKILITGAGGFVGQHLAHWLKKAYPDAQLHGTAYTGESTINDLMTIHQIDLCDVDRVLALLTDIQPEQIYHLAAQSFVPRSFDAPWETLQNNILGQLNLITACIELGIKPRIIVTGSAEVYGIVSPDEVPIIETAELRPTSPYAVSKITQDMLAKQYHISHQIPLIRVRAFNHFGVGQNERFVAPAFAIQIAKIEAGLQEPVMYVGDLSAKRDFTDVRDIVRAYQLLAEHGEAGEVYNVSSNMSYSGQELLDILIGLSDVEIRVEQDPARMRPTHLPILQGNYDRLHQATGWLPEFTFAQSLADILDDCRQRVAQNARRE